MTNGSVPSSTTSQCSGSDPSGSNSRESMVGHGNSLRSVDDSRSACGRSAKSPGVEADDDDRSVFAEDVISQLRTTAQKLLSALDLFKDSSKWRSTPTVWEGQQIVELWDPNTDEKAIAEDPEDPKRLAESMLSQAGIMEDLNDSGTQRSGEGQGNLDGEWRREWQEALSIAENLEVKARLLLADVDHLRPGTKEMMDKLMAGAAALGKAGGQARSINTLPVITEVDEKDNGPADPPLAIICRARGGKRTSNRSVKWNHSQELIDKVVSALSKGPYNIEPSDLESLLEWWEPGEGIGDLLKLIQGRRDAV